MQERGSKWIIVCGLLAVAAQAQTFNSGSNGTDGDLIINTPGVTTYTTLPVGGGVVYNFKTIQIAAGSTLKLSGSVFADPLYFLAQGAVTVAGTIDLSGQNGSTTPPATPAQRGSYTIPGAGGYGGGLPYFGSNAAEPGLGPAGGAINCASGTTYGGGGGFTGNQFLIPLLGGSGGAGSANSGGAGGGALLIASSVSITVNGTITANGGTAANYYPYAGAGAGGAIRLVAPLIAGTGTVTAAAGAAPAGGCTTGASGVTRLEAYTNTFSGTRGGTSYNATPVGTFLPVGGQPTIAVTSIGGVPVPASPTGSFVVPDVVLNSTSPLTVQIQAANIPLGTTAALIFTTENFPDQMITSTGLAGTLASSTATATVTLQPGYSLGYVTAKWTM